MKQIEENKVVRLVIVFTTFIGILIGIAYARMFEQISSAETITKGDFVLISVFFLTGLRFFIGNWHPLENFIQETPFPYKLLRLDFFVIVVEVMILILMGDVCLVAKNQSLRYDFVKLLLFLYIIDITWIFLRGIPRKLQIRGNICDWITRSPPPLGWAILNTWLVSRIVLFGKVGDVWYPFVLAAFLVFDFHVIVIAPRFLKRELAICIWTILNLVLVACICCIVNGRIETDFYTNEALIILGSTHYIAFIVDMWVMTYLKKDLSK